MISKKKPAVMDFTIDVSEFDTRPSRSDKQPSLPKKKNRDSDKPSVGAPKVLNSATAAKAKLSTSKANKRKTKSKMFDEELAVQGLDPDSMADDNDFGDEDDGMSSTKAKAAVTPAPKKKKKVRRLVSEPGTALAIVAPVEKNRISKIDKRKVKSIVGDDAERMLTLLEDDTSLDQAVRLIKRRLLQTMIDMVPQLETSMRNSDGRYGAHALNGSIQTIRELIIDIESAQDRGAIGETIVERVVRPAILEVATSIMEESATVLSEIKDLIGSDIYMEVRKAQIASRNRLAAVINGKYETMRTEIVNYLQR